MSKQNEFPARLVWTGNTGTGTSGYRDYKRNWDMALPGKPLVQCSNDPMLGGDPTKYNPEDLLITALSACHMLWYLHLCSVENITVTAYEDNPVGIGESAADGSGEFTAAILNPKIQITADSDPERAAQLHYEIHKYCFIARSVKFPVTYEPEIIIQT